MLISVIVPTLNEGSCIEKCLSSITSQGSDVEILVIDGGSTDNTREMAKKYTKKIYNLKKRGIGIARQVGAEKAVGKYVYMTDADCWASPNLLHDMVKMLEKSSAIAITGPTKYSGINGKIMQLWYYLYDKYYFRYKYGTIGLSGRNSLIRRDKLLDAIKGKEMPNFWEDGFMTFCLRKHGKMIYIDNLKNFSLERRLKNPLTLIKTIKMYKKGMKELKQNGKISSCHLPLTSGRNL